MNIVEQIKNKEKELEELREHYINVTPRCVNFECKFYHLEYSLNCMWCSLVTECEKYISEKID